MTLFGVISLVVLASLVAFITGLKRGGRVTDAWVALGTLAVGGAVALLLLGMRDPLVSGARVAGGVALGAVLLGVLPPALYYGAARGAKKFGRATPHPMTLSGLWLMSLIPLIAFTLYVLLAAITLVHCQPGQYECPV